MILQEARALADQIVVQMTPYTDRCEIAGSVRRGKPEVKDIEIVCIPKKTNRGTRDISFAIQIHNIGYVVKGDPCMGKYFQVWTPQNIAVDIFTATPDNWGLIYAIRTGSARFSHEVLARGWYQAGYHSNEGMLHRQGIPVPVREEADLFRLIGIPLLAPEDRV